jgi:hypothetical protein
MRISKEQYAQLRIDFIRILIPTPEQRDPKSRAMVTERKTIDELMEAIKRFVEGK